MNRIFILSEFRYGFAAISAVVIAANDDHCATLLGQKTNLVFTPLATLISSGDIPAEDDRGRDIRGVRLHGPEIVDLVVASDLPAPEELQPGVVELIFNEVKFFELLERHPRSTLCMPSVETVIEEPRQLSSGSSDDDSDDDDYRGEEADNANNE